MTAARDRATSSAQPFLAQLQLGPARLQHPVVAGLVGAVGGQPALHAAQGQGQDVLVEAGQAGIGRELARALGLLRIFGRDLSRAEAMVDRLPVQPFQARFKPGVFDAQGRRRRVAYFVGCGVDVVSHAAAEATLALLRRFSRSVQVLNNNCCGLPAWSYGDLSAARKLAGKNPSAARS